MMKRIRHILLGSAMVVAVLPFGNALASPAGNAQDMGLDLDNAVQNQLEWRAQNSEQFEMLFAQAQQKISDSQAKAAAMRQVRGAKFVNVQLINPSTYRVRLQQKNGRIIDVLVDAYTGRVKG